ncbi:YdcF family protein [Dongshaea marina]|uniref:YdcF family protein n=1 Tax=Dongshaea marina TaxID=2047966 RepID=UPI000D3EB842|nr:YdcF family protein [Dongshaea marina]
MAELVAGAFHYLSLFLYPTVLLFVVILLVLLCKGRKLANTLLILALAGFYLTGNGVITDYLVTPLEKGLSQVNSDIIRTHQSMVILGGGIAQNQEDSQSGLLADSRVVEAYRIYQDAEKQQVQYSIFISGGHNSPSGMSQAGLFKRQLMTLGVPESQLVIERASQNSYQNAQFTKQMLDSHHASSPLLITSALSMKQAAQAFSHFGVEVTPAPANFPKAQRSYFPSVYNLELTRFAIHEYTGQWKLKLFKLLGINKHQLEQQVQL